MRRYAIYIIAAFVTFAVGIAITVFRHKESVKIGKPVPYQILEDDMGFRISIGVEANIDEGQLCATLRKAADEHQGDAARDYLMADRLLVDAYLIDGGKRSNVMAGTLSRYVPPRNPNISDEDPLTEKEDQFFITLKSARDSLK